jgi:hypothetical protein
LCRWIISFEKLSFAEELNRLYKEFETAAYAAKRAQLPEILAAKKAQEEDLNKFLSQLQGLMAAKDPTQNLKSLPSNLGILFPSVLTLNSGEWSAYFLVNRKAKRLDGLCVSRAKNDAESLLRLVKDAIKHTGK